MKRLCLLTLLLAIGPMLAAAYSQEELSPALRAPNVYTGAIPERFSDESRPFQGIPSVTQSSDGSLWACWYGGPGENVWTYVLAARSVDLGKTWSRPIVVVDWPGEVRVYDPNVWSDPDGALWLFWAQSEGTNNDGRLGVWAIKTTSPEQGANAKWSAPRRLCNGIMLNKPTVVSDGRWLLPVSHKPNGKIYQIDPRLLGAAVYVSTDGGETLYCLGIADVPEDERGCDEHMVVEKKDGTLKLYSRAAHGIGESTSSDGGRTWTQVQISETIKHPSSRFYIRRLRSGNWLLVKNGPIDQQTGRERMTAFLSKDEGKTWQGGLVIDEREDVSYPDAQQLNDDSIAAVYDHGRTSEREILLARFTEEDVLAGKIVSDKGALKIVVNKSGK